jgi:hypothetical protein
MDYSYGYGGVPALAEGSGYVAPSAAGGVPDNDTTGQTHGGDPHDNRRNECLV